MDGKTKNNKKVITIVALLLIAIVAAFGVWYFNFRENEPSSDNQQAATQQVGQESLVQISEDGTSVSYVGVEGQTALSLLKQYTNVDTEEFTGIGEYVVSINGVSADSTNNFWGFYVNGEQAQVGAGEYISTNGDEIEWRLENVEAFEE